MDHAGWPSFNLTWRSRTRPQGQPIGRADGSTVFLLEPLQWLGGLTTSLSQRYGFLVRARRRWAALAVQTNCVKNNRVLFW